jgi:fatty acid desaturase
MPFYCWRYTHARHHALAGVLEKDPILKLMREYRGYSRAKKWMVQLAWRSWIPLLGLAQYLLYWYQPVLSWRVAAHRRYVAREAASLVALIAALVAGGALVPDYLGFRAIAPALAIHFALIEIVNFPHHLGLTVHSADVQKLPLWDQYEITRSSYYPPPVAALLWLNFNFHTEHHVFPNLPFYRLWRARQELRRALGDRYLECISLRWNLETRARSAADVLSTDRPIPRGAS